MIRRFRPAFWPTVISVPALIVLLALGTWQMNRLAWKEGLIRAFAERVNAEALTTAPPSARSMTLNIAASDSPDAISTTRRCSLPAAPSTAAAAGRS